MNSITQDLKFKQSVVEYSLKYGVTRASIQYEVHRKTIYRWREKYDGSINSLRNKSRRPKSHPNQHTQEEIEMIKRYKAHNKEVGLVVLWASKEHSTYASAQFIEIVIKKFKFKIECIQTDNEFEFTNRLNRHMSWKQTMFEKVLEQKGIKHKLIKPKTPRHNGKVERNHRKDQERFYYKRVFVSFEDFKEKLRHWEIEYNNFPMKPLGWKSPNEKLAEILVA